MKIFLMILLIVTIVFIIYKFHSRRERFRKRILQLNNKNKKRSYR